MRPTILRNQSDVYQDLIDEVGDPATGGLWTEPEVYRAINRSLYRWAGRVFVPRRYNFPDPFASGVYNVALPDYMTGLVDVEIRSEDTDNNGQEDTTYTTWLSVPGGNTEVNDDGDGVDYRFQVTPYDAAGRATWWLENGPVPTTIPTLDTGIDADDLSLVVDAAVNVAPAGWLQLEGERIFYAGVVRGASTTTLTLQERGADNTEAASHLAAVDIEWCVAVDDYRLWDQLHNQAVAFLHQFKSHRGTKEDYQRHTEMMNYMQGQADSSWRTMGYVPQRLTEMRLTRRGMR